MNDIKRLFFGLDIIAPWPAELPFGRVLDPSCRHLTLAFLGQADFAKLYNLLPTIPPLPREIGFAGVFDSCLFLPKRHPHVVAWHAAWLEDGHLIEEYQKKLTGWLKNHGISVDEKAHFLPHVTLCRSPFHISSWKKAFQRLPFITQHLQLYESLGHSRYEPLWSLPFTPPFEEIEHTADLAFDIWGKHLHQIHLHAFLALAFKFPPLLDYWQAPTSSHLDDVIMDLNNRIAQADAEIGCPFKAISFHGHLQEEANQLLKWEMIVDV